MSPSPDLMLTALKMLTALGAVLGGLLILYYFARRMVPRDGGGSNRNLTRVLAHQYVGLKKSVALVEIPGAILVLGVSSDNICLLTKIEDPTLLDQFQQRAAAPPIPSFSDHLNKIVSRFKGPPH
ncbi:MAG: flagellar biosynthetic protein FliO [Desulfobacterales bacterium]|nr:MAG: flagellar biosynthetic protein FliO [Desulfobacterales bacterium]